MVMSHVGIDVSKDLNSCIARPTAIEGINPGDLLFQVAQYAVVHPKPVAGALYTLDIGGNDIFKALDEFHAGQISSSVISTVMAQAETNTIHAVDELYTLGVRNLVFYEVPDWAGPPSQCRRTSLAKFRWPSCAVV